MDTFAIREPALLPTAVVGEASPGVGMPGQLDTVENIDLLLVKRARRGDQRAFETLLDRHDARLRALAYRVLGERDLMDDALQEVAIKAFLSLGSFRGDSSFGTWLYRLTYTTCLNELRSRSRRIGAAEEDLAELPDTAPDTATVVGDRDAVQRALARLSPQQRVAVLLVMEQGWDLKTAGHVLGIPKGTVASRLSIARTTLRRTLSESDGAAEGR